MTEKNVTGLAVDPTVVEEELPDGELSSLRRIQYLYGLIDELEAAVDHPYSAYLTPEEFESNFDGEDDESRGDSVLVVRVDLTDPENPQLDPDRPFEAVRYTPDLASDVAHSHNSASRGLDYSITHQTGTTSGISTIAKYLRQRLNKWPTYDPIVDFSNGATIEDPTPSDEGERPDDVEVIDALATLGADEDVTNAVTDWVESLDPDPPALVTVRVRREENGRYEWPGEVEVLNRAMQYYRFRDYIESRQHGSASSGVGLDRVLGKHTPLVGGAKDPLNYYRVKQRERFPGLDYRDAWRSHPVGPDTALRIESAERFLNACYTGQQGLRVYYLPYLTGDVDATDIDKLYQWLTDLERADGGRTVVDVLTRRRDDPDRSDEDLDRVRLYAIVLEAYQNQRYRVYGEAPEAGIRQHVNLARTHQSVVDGPLFNSDGLEAFPSLEDGFENTDVSENGYPYPLIDTGIGEHTMIDRVASGAYFAETLPTPADDPSPDDPWVEATLELAREGIVSEQRLLEGFEQRLSEESTEDFFRYEAAQQVAQLRALSKAGYLSGASYYPQDVDRQSPTSPDDPADTNGEGTQTANGTVESNTHASVGQTTLETFDGDAQGAIERTSHTRPQTHTDEVMSESSSTTDRLSRAQKLNNYLNESPHLSLEDNSERRMAFLVGALVGKISRYQTNHLSLSQTLRRQYPVGKLSPSRAEQLVSAVLDRNNVYAQEDGQVIMYESYVTRLVETQKHCDSDWANAIPEATLRHDYGIGMAYGLTDQTKKSPDEEGSSSNKSKSNGDDTSNEEATDSDEPRFA